MACDFYNMKIKRDLEIVRVNTNQYIAFHSQNTKFLIAIQNKVQNQKVTLEKCKDGAKL